MLAYTRERLIESLTEITHLIDFYQKRDPSFVERTVKWLTELEKILLQVKSPLASFVATERGKILAVADGYHDPLLAGGKTSKRKLALATTSIVLSRIDEILRQTISEIDAKFNAWREKMAQFLAVATAKVPIPLPPVEPRRNWLEKVWKQLAVNDETGGMYRYLNAAMRVSDRLYLLDEVMENLLTECNNQ